MRCVLLISLFSLAGCARAGFHGLPDGHEGTRDLRLTEAGIVLDSSADAPVDDAMEDIAQLENDAIGLADHRFSDAAVDEYVTGAHDTCATAKVIDMRDYPGGSVEIAFDTAGAQLDYGQAVCNGAPEVVIRLTNFEDSGGSVNCVGGGNWIFWTATPPQACPGDPTRANVATCTSNTFGMSGFVNELYIMVCRPPAQGPATLLIQLQ